jgi:hypothetical protein
MQETRETCMKTNFVNGMSHQKLTDQNRENEISEICDTCGGGEVLLPNFGGETRKNDHLEN